MSARQVRLTMQASTVFIVGSFNVIIALFLLGVSNSAVGFMGIGESLVMDCICLSLLVATDYLCWKVVA